MLAHDCGAADALLTASARYGIRMAGRDAGTGALNQTQELSGKLRRRLKSLAVRRRRHLYALSDSRLQLVLPLDRLAVDEQPEPLLER